jgi:UDP-N-acetylmuramoylalanine--D-glutamate ligase
VADYARAKARLFAQQDENDVAVMNADDPWVCRIPVPSRRLEFSRKKRLINGAFIDGDRIVAAFDGRPEAELRLGDLQLVGAHNHENVMAALLMAISSGVKAEEAVRAAAAFKGLPHRVELVGEHDGIRYYDDSKGTNVGAVLRSLEGFDQPVILIAGGRDKEGDFRPLRRPVKERVKLLILIGEAAPDMSRVLSSSTRTVLAGDMAEAVRLAQSEARAGDVVLLSPACASFDMFRDYAHRGEVFRQCVQAGADGC